MTLTRVFWGQAVSLVGIFFSLLLQYFLHNASTEERVHCSTSLVGNGFDVAGKRAKLVLSYSKPTLHTSIHPHKKATPSEHKNRKHGLKW